MGDGGQVPSRQRAAYEWIRPKIVGPGVACWAAAAHCLLRKAKIASQPPPQLSGQGDPFDWLDEKIPIILFDHESPWEDASRVFPAAMALQRFPSDRLIELFDNFEVEGAIIHEVDNKGKDASWKGDRNHFRWVEQHKNGRHIVFNDRSPRKHA